MMLALSILCFLLAFVAFQVGKLEKRVKELETTTEVNGSAIDTLQRLEAKYHGEPPTTEDLAEFDKVFGRGGR